MKTLVVYDSVNGNTERIAKSIAEAIVGGVQPVRANSATPESLVGLDILIIGSPTYGGRPTPDMLNLLGRIQASSIKGVKVAAFDTRMTSRFVKMFGFAADKILADLAGKGGSAAATPEGFFVKGRAGPLVDGELQRAADWARSFVK